jgi:hypothetical protein
MSRSCNKIGIFAFLSVLSFTTRSDAVCVMQHNWRASGFTAIPVYLHPSMASNMRHASGASWTNDELQAEIRWLLESANDKSAANLPPLYYAGTSAGVCETCTIPGAIHVANGGDCATGYMEGSPSGGIKLQFAKSGACGVTYYHFKSPTGPAEISFGGVFMHELGHALGIDHPTCVPYACSTPPCSVMDSNAGNTGEAMEWFRNDIEGLRAKYGAFDSTRQMHRESSSGLNYNNLGTASIGALPGFSLSSSLLSNMFIAYTNKASNSSCARMWDWTTLSLASWGCVGWLTYGLVAAAYDGAAAYSAGLVGETLSSAAKRISLFKQTSPSNMSRTISSWSGMTTTRHGIAMAHDPKNSIRILAWRSSNGTIMLQPEVGGVIQDPTMTSHVAYGTPSVACGDAAIALNCIVVWATPATEGPYHQMRWFHFRMRSSSGTYRVDCASGDCGNVYTLGYLMFSAPQVAYKGPVTDPGAFVVTWKNPECNFYSLRKAAADAALFSDEQGHSLACNHSAGQPAAGSSNASAELLNVGY